MQKTYEQHAASSNREYNAAYAAWLADMSPTERHQMKKMGLGSALSPNAQSGAVEGERADFFREPEYDDEGEAVETPEAEEADASQGEEETETLEARYRLNLATAVNALIVELLTSRNRGLAVECLALCTHIAYDGVSEAAIATKYGLSRAAVSRRCVELCDRLGIEPPRGMRRAVAEAEANGESTDYDLDTRAESGPSRVE